MSFTTGFRYQIAGVAVAIALVPPVSAARLTFSSSSYHIGLKALNLALMNALPVPVVGYICLKVLGLHPSTYHKKQSPETMRNIIPIVIFILMLLGIPLTFSVYEASEPGHSFQREAEEYFGEDLIDVRRIHGGLNVFVVGM